LSIEKVIGTALTSVTYPAIALPLDHQDWFTFDFPDVNLTVGETYHIVIRFNNVSEYAWSGAYGDPYPPGFSSRLALWDYAFKTIVDQIASPELEIVVKGGLLGYTYTITNVGEEWITGNFTINIFTDAAFMFLGRELSGSPDCCEKLPPGESVEFRIGPVLGFGPAVINIEGIFETPDVYPFETEANGFVLLFFLSCDAIPINIP